MNKTRKKPWRWDPIHQQAFDNVKAAIAKETVLAYLDFFEAPRDSRLKIAFFNRKLSEMQQKYSVTEIELWP